MARRSRFSDEVRERAAKDRQRWVRAALSELKKVEEEKKKASEKDEVRASTTDAEARVMKMADGGFRPAYNAQFASDSDTGVIVGVDVCNVGLRHPAARTDARAARGALRKLNRGHARRWWLRKPGRHRNAGGRRLPRVRATDAAARSRAQSVSSAAPEIARWRRRMGTASGKRKYRKRCEGEVVNANARNRGLLRLLVRGLRRVRCDLLLHGLANNALRTHTLRAQLA